MLLDTLYTRFDYSSKKECCFDTNMDRNVRLFIAMFSEVSIKDS